MLSDPACHELIQIARTALKAAVRGDSFSPATPEDEALLARCGCFVTYKTGGQLRGCLGCFTASDPLFKTVARYATLSATEDPRFAGNRMKEEELERVDMEISVLSPLQACDNPESIQLGKHGIYIKSGHRSGCFLPQVATETGWTIDEFWGHCCTHKAGLSREAWKQAEVECYTFTAQVIADPHAASAGADSHPD